MILSVQRAAGGEIAAEKGVDEWAFEGEPKLQQAFRAYCTTVLCKVTDTGRSTILYRITQAEDSGKLQKQRGMTRDMLKCVGETETILR